LKKKIAIIQSNYIPWKGYFDMINLVDEFILYDDMQYTRRDWRNRNLIKTPRGLKWLTIPISVKGKYFQKIKDTEVKDNCWPIKHWETLRLNYHKASHFKVYESIIEQTYQECKEMKLLSQINFKWIRLICRLMDIPTKISWSMDYPPGNGKTQRLVELCKAAEAKVYLSGPSAKAYINTEIFQEAGIDLQYMDYSGYPEYPQLYGAFGHGVSILDLLFNTGKEAPRYLKSFRGV